MPLVVCCECGAEMRGKVKDLKYYMVPAGRRMRPMCPECYEVFCEEAADRARSTKAPPTRG